MPCAMCGATPASGQLKQCANCKVRCVAPAPAMPLLRTCEGLARGGRAEGGDG